MHHRPARGCDRRAPGWGTLQARRYRLAAPVLGRGIDERSSNQPSMPEQVIDRRLAFACFNVLRFDDDGAPLSTAPANVAAASSTSRSSGSGCASRRRSSRCRKRPNGPDRVGPVPSKLRPQRDSKGSNAAPHDTQEQSNRGLGSLVALPSARGSGGLDQHVVQSGPASMAIAVFAAPAADPIAAALDDASEAWRSGGDARELRRALLRVLAELEVAP